MTTTATNASVLNHCVLTTSVVNYNNNYLYVIDHVQSGENIVTDNINSKSLIVTGKELDKKVVQKQELVIGIETSSSPNPRKDKSSVSKYS